MRRRARYLRRVRELAYRDLGGLVFNLHRFGQRNDALVTAKLTTLSQLDGELRALEVALAERRPLTVLREAGITACVRCAAIHSSEDSFCPNCGLALGGHPDLPIAGPANTPAASTVAATAVGTAAEVPVPPADGVSAAPPPSADAAASPPSADPAAAPDEPTEILRPSGEP
jgi:hypothetical protein